ncbi:hypothetical protein GQ54DRAFT_75182 [Martensiomyces pterosporus]|nr:hypothetical protein GQ54DRAFT_75182 [Martensiomyces pterosporus]
MLALCLLLPPHMSSQSARFFYLFLFQQYIFRPVRCRCFRAASLSSTRVACVGCDRRGSSQTCGLWLAACFCGTHALRESGGQANAGLAGAGAPRTGLFSAANNTLEFPFSLRAPNPAHSPRDLFVLFTRQTKNATSCASDSIARPSSALSSAVAPCLLLFISGGFLAPSLPRFYFSSKSSISYASPAPHTPRAAQYAHSYACPPFSFLRFIVNWVIPAFSISFFSRRRYFCFSCNKPLRIAPAHAERRCFLHTAPSLRLLRTAGPTLQSTLIRPRPA